MRDFAAARGDTGAEPELTTSLRHWERRAGVALAATTSPAASGDAPSTRVHRHRIGEPS